MDATGGRALISLPEPPCAGRALIWIPRRVLSPSIQQAGAAVVCAEADAVLLAGESASAVAASAAVKLLCDPSGSRRSRLLPSSLSLPRLPALPPSSRLALASASA